LSSYMEVVYASELKITRKTIAHQLNF